MITIFICDDERAFLDFLGYQIKSVFDELKIETRIKAFTSPKECLYLIRKSDEPPDAVFLDIDMPGLSGFEIAEEIKKGRANPLVIFVSGKHELVFKSFDYHPFSFVRKGTGESFRPELLKVCSGIVAALRQKTPIEILDVDLGTVHVSTEDIIYAKCDGHYLVYRTKVESGSLRERSTVKDKMTILRPCGFIRPHVSFLVNTAHIGFFSAKVNKIVLDTKEFIPISRQMKDKALKDYLQFMRIR